VCARLNCRRGGQVYADLVDNPVSRSSDRGHQATQLSSLDGSQLLIFYLTVDGHGHFNGCGGGEPPPPTTGSTDPPSKLTFIAAAIAAATTGLVAFSSVDDAFFVFAIPLGYQNSGAVSRTPSQGHHTPRLAVPPSSSRGRPARGNTQTIPDAYLERKAASVWLRIGHLLHQVRQQHF
jgi:hypothetical protein